MRALACILGAAGLAAQAVPAFQELRRLRWQDGRARCAALQADGELAALGLEDADGTWSIALFDLARRRRLQRLSSPRPIAALRFVDAAHLDVRTYDTDAFVSFSHWRVVRLADGREVGEPRPYRPSQDDPPDPGETAPPELAATIAGSSYRSLVRFAAGRAVLCNAERGAVVWRQGALLGLTDFVCRALAFTPDGRYVVAWLPSRLLALPVAGGEPQVLPVHSEDVRALCAGSDGDHCVVITADEVAVVAVALARVLLRVPIPVSLRGEDDRQGAAARSIQAVMAPGGGELALWIADPDDSRVGLLSLSAGRWHGCAPDCGAPFWTPDGRSLWVVRGVSAGTGGVDGPASLARLDAAAGLAEELPLGQLSELDETAVWSLGPRRFLIGAQQLSLPRDGAPVLEQRAGRCAGVLSAATALMDEDTQLALRDTESWDLLAAQPLTAELRRGPSAVSPKAGRCACILGGELVVWQLPATSR